MFWFHTIPDDASPASFDYDPRDAALHKVCFGLFRIKSMTKTFFCRTNWSCLLAAAGPSGDKSKPTPRTPFCLTSRHTHEVFAPLSMGHGSLFANRLRITKLEKCANNIHIIRTFHHDDGSDSCRCPCFCATRILHSSLLPRTNKFFIKVDDTPFELLFRR